MSLVKTFSNISSLRLRAPGLELNEILKEPELSETASSWARNEQVLKPILKELRLESVGAPQLEILLKPLKGSKPSEPRSP